MFQKKINLVFIFLITIMVIYSCVDDDVCDKASTPRLTIGIDSLGATHKVDSLYIDRKLPDGSFSQTVYVKTDSLQVPLNAISNETVLYLYRKFKTPDADKDIITIKYQTEQEFVSKACGFKATYSNVTYEHTQKKEIKDITQKTTEIYNESKNLLITY